VRIGRAFSSGYHAEIGGVAKADLIRGPSIAADLPDAGLRPWPTFCGLADRTD